MRFPRRYRLGFGLALAATSLIVGCQSGKRSEAPIPKRGAADGDQRPPITDAINVGPGDLTAYSTNLPRRPVWKLLWKSARIQPGQKENSLGEVTEASGFIYPEAEAPVPFSAASGSGDQAKGQLYLRENVTIFSPTLKATLRCDLVHYDASAKIVEAKGNVRVTSEDGTVTTNQELWATPDLSIVGTKDEFMRLRSSAPPH